MTLDLWDKQFDAAINASADAAARERIEVARRAEREEWENLPATERLELCRFELRKLADDLIPKLAADNAARRGELEAEIVALEATIAAEETAPVESLPALTAAQQEAIEWRTSRPFEALRAEEQLWRWTFNKLRTWLDKHDGLEDAGLRNVVLAEWTHVRDRLTEIGYLTAAFDRAQETIATGDIE